MRALLLLFLTLLVLVGSAAAIQGNATLNTSVENSSATVSLNVTLLENETLFVVPVSVDSRLNYSYPSSLFFNTSSMQLNVTVEPATEFFENVTINSTFNLSNSLNNNTFLYTITTEVIAEPLFNESQDFFINVVNGEYLINISTNLIPKTGSLAYRIQGIEGSLLKISCPADSWLSCPENRTFGSQNDTTFSINYTVPENASIGSTSYLVRLDTGNITIQRNVTFNIYEPDLILQQYVFDEACFSEDSQGDLTLTYDCILEYQQFQYDQTVQIINRLREDRKQECTAENVTEHLYVGNVEEEVIQQLHICRDDVEILRDDLSDFQKGLSTKENQLSSCQDNLSIARTALSNNESECLQNVFSTSVELKNQAEREREATLEIAKRERRQTVWIVVGIIAVFAGVAGFFAWKKASQREAWT